MIASLTDRGVFIDTSGWIALLNADDQSHGIAARTLDQLAAHRRPLITTDWVIGETGNGLARHPTARLRFVQAVETFRSSTQGRLIRVGSELFESALALYKQSSDKTWGLVDCATFAFMRLNNLNEALTADRHFQQAGFRSLLLETE